MRFDAYFPSSNSIRDLCEFSKEIMEEEEKAQFHISAKRLGFVTPTTMIFLAKACRQRAKKFKDEKRVYHGLSALSYANNLGFSDALRLKGRPLRQGAFGGKSYIPITNITRRRLEESAAENGTQIGDEIEARCGTLADVVSQGRTEYLRKALQRSFCEIIRNCFEHGETGVVHFCAQHWPQRDEVEICISDMGIGVLQSLRSGKYNIPKDYSEALKFSIMPGVSSKAWRNKKKKASQRSVWDNAGYGLFFAHHLFGNLGHFMIASGSRALFLNADSFKEYECNVQGTVVSLRLDLSDEQRIRETVDSVATMAMEIKQRLGVKSLDIKSIEAYLKSNSL